MADRSVGIVVPAYAPAVATLLRTLAELRTAVPGAHLRVEWDGAIDDDTVAALGGVELHVAPTRRGKGKAVTDGFNALAADVETLAFVDADGATDPATVTAVVEACRQTGGLVAASRRHPHAHVETDQGAFRRFLGGGLVWLARRALGTKLHDYQCGAKAIDAATWRSIRQYVLERGFAWDLEFVELAGAVGSVTELPAVWRDQPGSTVDARTAVPEFLGALRRLRKRRRHGPWPEVP